MDLLLRVLILAGVGLGVWILAKVLRTYFRRARVPARFDTIDALDKNKNNSNGALLVEFTSPYCYECREALPYLKAASMVHGARLEVIDAKDRPDLASKYDIRHTPTILVVDTKGEVRAGWTGIPPSDELEAALAAVGAEAA